VARRSFDAMVRRMLADPELTGNTLLLAIGIAEAVTAPGAGSKVPLQPIAEKLGVTRHFIRYVIADDRPRYEPRTEWPLPCRGQMIRRPGLCGQNSTNRFWLWYPADTGEREEIGACSRHRLEVQAITERSRQAWIAAGKPTPPGNTGGHLERYFGGDWDVTYAWATPSWKRPPSSTVRTDMRPALRLIIGGADDDG
jgi:hypothetical protein